LIIDIAMLDNQYLRWSKNVSKYENLFLYFDSLSSTSNETSPEKN